MGGCLRSGVFSIVVSRSRVSSGTSSRLFRVEQGVHTGTGSIHRGLSSVVRSTRCRGFLRRPVMARQGNEFIIPMGSRRHKSIPNLIRSVSTSKTAIFVRPISIISTGGSVGVLRDDRHSRVHEVLFRLSNRTNGFSRDVGCSCRDTIRLSLVFTGTRLTCGVGTSGPVLGGRKVALLGGTHRPLLSPGGTIPIGVSLNRGFSALIVANPGANNGAISVGAVNLLDLVTVYNLLIPTTSRSEVTICGNVCTGINSRRDVRRGLSAFSTGVIGIVRVVHRTNRGSLILVSRLNTKASPIRNTTLTISVVRCVHTGNTGVTTAARCTRLGTCTLGAPNIVGNYYRFSIRALEPACGLLVNIPNESGTFTVSRRLKVSGDIVRRTGGVVNDRGRSFRDILRGLRRAELRLRGRGRGTRGTIHSTSGVHDHTRSRGSGVTRLGTGRVRGTGHRTGGVVSSTGHRDTSFLLHLSRLGGRTGPRATASITEGAHHRVGGEVNRVRSAISPHALTRR